MVKPCGPGVGVSIWGIIMENQMEKKMENEMEAGIILGLYYIIALIWGLYRVLILWDIFS